MNRPLVVTATPTAFAADGSVDLDSTTRVFEHALAGGVDALFVNGTTAEFPALDRAERRAALAAAAAVAGPDRVIAHVGAAGPFETAQLARDAAELGITRASVLTPYYLPASLDGVRRQVDAALATLPAEAVFLYLFPDRTGVQLPADAAAAVIDDYGLAGAKISIAGTGYLAELVAALRTPRTVLSGNDGLLREVVAAGGGGVVSGVSSAIAPPFVRLRDAMEAGDTAEVDAAAAPVNAVVPVLGSSIAALKESLALQGVIADAGCRLAIDPLDPATVDRVHAITREHATGAVAAP
ncbi:MAG: dihydrodipicolinate synthase family protein [Actinomycetales bacterium]|nr:dihydrodipicolinate synthase family protein [Actinomycetales bacterium]